METYKRYVRLAQLCGAVLAIGIIGSRIWSIWNPSAIEIGKLAFAIWGVFVPGWFAFESAYVEAKEPSKLADTAKGQKLAGMVLATTGVILALILGLPFGNNPGALNAGTGISATGAGSAGTSPAKPRESP
jgi:hypothetical protein